MSYVLDWLIKKLKPKIEYDNGIFGTNLELDESGGVNTRDERNWVELEEILGREGLVEDLKCYGQHLRKQPLAKLARSPENRGECLFRKSLVEGTLEKLLEMVITKLDSNSEWWKTDYIRCWLVVKSKPDISKLEEVDQKGSEGAKMNPLLGRTRCKNDTLV
jgi:hypothetical protein